MKNFKNKLRIILTIGITAILVGGFSVYATYNYIAKDVSYTKANGETISVETALNELYEKNINILDKIDGTIQTSYYMGNRENGHSISLNLEKGNYYVFIVNSYSWSNSTIFNTKGAVSNNALSSNTFTCTLLNGYYTCPTASNKYNSLYQSHYTCSQIYKCSSNTNGTISFKTSNGTYLDCAESVIMQSLKID